MSGERYGNVVLGQHPTWLPRFGSFTLPKPDRVEDGVAHIDDVKTLQEHLQLALMVELSTIPTYLYGMYSVDQANDKTNARTALFSVVIQEMLHLVLAGNALKAVGGSPTLYPKKGHLEYFPKYPMHMAGHADPPVVLALRRPDLYQVLSYLHVELPEVSGAAPESEQYHSLGQFYDAIKIAMNNLLPKIPDLIDPTSADFQFSSDDGIYYTRPSGGIIQVVDIKTAAAAFDTIIEQGEGAGGSSHDEDPSELAHFFQFAKLLQAPPPAVIKTIDNPKTPDYKDPKIAAVAGLSDATYCLLLLTIENCWKHSRKDAHRDEFVKSIFPIMTGALKPLCEWLVTQPLGDGTFAGPGFNYFDYAEGDPLVEIQALADAVVAKFGSDVPESISAAVTSLKSLKLNLHPVKKAAP